MSSFFWVVTFRLFVSVFTRWRCRLGSLYRRCKDNKSNGIWLIHNTIYLLTISDYLLNTNHELLLQGDNTIYSKNYTSFVV
ncbi:hypothetical protein ACT29H_16250 [Thermophagus sp. OGC60D27]|uniref:hypothetical protein n=1 Tax=Thermophagus sp. OGC60D27 TaxID=3458415 RepID=UPI004037684E